MKKYLARMVMVSMVLSSLAIALPAQAAALPNWDITGTWTFNDIWLGVPYVHTMVINSFDPTTGAFSGTGFYNADPSLTWTVNGVESGNDITVFNLLVLTVAPGVTIAGTGTINSSTLISGAGYQSNLPGSNPNIAWTAVGNAKPITYVNHIGPITSGSADGSSCGGTWANDTYNLFFMVVANGDGTYKVTTFYKDGNFVTTGGASPGSCATDNHHGSTVKSGINGKFQGFVSETVTASSFDPSVCSIAGNCLGRGAFISQAFGGSSENNFSWNFEYNSSDKTLTYRHWQDRANPGGSEVFVGDIANN